MKDMLLPIALLQVSLSLLPTVKEPLAHLEQVRGSLGALDFRALNASMAKDQQEAEAGNGERWEWTLRAFDAADARIDGALQKWEAQFPGAWQPLLAQAARLSSSADNARGTKWASETSEEQFARMRAFHARMANKCQAVLRMKANVCPCHALLVSAAIRDGEGSLKVKEAAIRACPTDYHMLADLLASLTPRWGGSYTLVERELAAAGSRGVSAYDMARLRSLVRAEQSLDLRDAKKPDELFALLNEAVRLDPTPSVFRLRAAAQRERRDPVAALADANEAVRRSAGGWQISPWNFARLMVVRAWALNRLGRREDARLDIQSALIAEPTYEPALRWVDILSSPRVRP